MFFISVSYLKIVEIEVDYHFHSVKVHLLSKQMLSFMTPGFCCIEPVTHSLILSIHYCHVRISLTYFLKYMLLYTADCKLLPGATFGLNCYYFNAATKRYRQTFPVFIKNIKCIIVFTINNKLLSKMMYVFIGEH